MDTPSTRTCVTQAAVGPTPALPVSFPPALAYDVAVARHERWPVETRAIVVAAAVVSLLSLVTWGGTLWRYVQPSAFPRSRLTLGQPLSPDFASFVLHAAMNVLVVVGALTALANRRLARRLMLAGALGVLVLAVYQFASFTLLQTGLTIRRQGPDRLVFAAIDGARLVQMNLVHGLVVLVMTLRGPWTRTTADPSLSWPVETVLIVAAVAVASAVAVADRAAILWIRLQPHLFKRIGAGDWTVLAYTLFAAGLVLHLLVLGGAGLGLFGRRLTAARRLLLLAAVGLLCLTAYGYARSVLAPPPDFPRYQGPEAIVTGVGSAARLLIADSAQVLLIFAMTRRSARP